MLNQLKSKMQNRKKRLMLNQFKNKTQNQRKKKLNQL
jgi:hypothetical protein